MYPILLGFCILKNLDSEYAVQAVFGSHCPSPLDMARYKAAIQKIAFFEEQLVEWQEYWNIALLKERKNTKLCFKESG